MNQSVSEFSEHMANPNVYDNSTDDDGACDREYRFYEDHNDVVVESFMDTLEDDGKDVSNNSVITRKYSAGLGGEYHSSDELEGRRVIAKFLVKYTCYDILPESSKVVVFDRNIPIRLSYYALVEHEIGAAPLWDPLTQSLSGIIEAHDFIEMLRYGHGTDSLLEILDNHSVASWRSLVAQLCESPDIADSLIKAGMPAVRAASMAADYEQSRGVPSSMYKNFSKVALSVRPESSLYEACCTIRSNGVHWLPVLDQKEQLCIGVISHLSILQYLVTHFVEDRRLFEQPILSLGIGTVSGLITATLSTNISTILDLICVNNISSVPIVDTSGKPIAVFARSNVIDLVSYTSLENSLDLSLGELLRDLIFTSEGIKNHQDGTDFGDPGNSKTERSNDLPEDEIPQRMRIHTCNPNDTLQEIFVKFALARVYRLLFVDEEGCLEGIVTLSDLLGYFLD